MPTMLLPARRLGALLLAGVASTVAARDLHGAGATFPAPLYASWADAYAPVCRCQVRYDALGSGAGIDLVERGQVDFGASDAPLSDDERARHGLIQVPVVIGAVVPVVNIAGLAPGELVLDAAALSAIYRGRIRKWNDAAIVALNPTLKLPAANITVVHRQDASGTTWLWSRYLSGADPAWQRELGMGTTLAWPTGTGGVGNEGVASLVQRTRWAIGYVEFAYARAHRLSDVALPARDGAVVRASRAAFEAAAAAARWNEPRDLEQDLTSAPGAHSWPVVGASYVLVPREHGADALAFVEWTLANGAAAASALDYVPLPAAARRLTEAVIAHEPR